MTRKYISARAWANERLKDPKFKAARTACQSILTAARPPGAGGGFGGGFGGGPGGV